MPVNCKLCREPIGVSNGASRCHCGWRLDGGCRDGHDAWCPTHGEDSWLGAQEF